MIAIKGVGKLRNDAFYKPTKDYGSTGKIRRGSVMLFLLLIIK